MAEVRSREHFTRHIVAMLTEARLTLEEGRDQNGIFPWKLPERDAARLIAAITALEAEVKACTPISNEPRRLSLVHSA